MTREQRRIERTAALKELTDRGNEACELANVSIASAIDAAEGKLPKALLRKARRAREKILDGGFALENLE